MLVDKCRIYEEDSRARSAHYKMTSEKKAKDQNRAKPYGVPADKEKHEFQSKSTGEKGTSGGALVLL